MSESHMLFKLILALGLIFVFIGLLAQSFPQYAGATTPWNNFSNSLSTGVQFPTFSNPYDINQATTILLPVAPSLPFSAPSVGCQNWTYYQCLQTIDGNTSYVHLQFVNALNQCFTNGTNPPDRCGDAVVRMKGAIARHAFIEQTTYNFFCRSNNATILGRFAFFISNTNENSTYSCPYSATSFHQISITSSIVKGNKDQIGNYWSDNFNGNGWQVEMRVCGVSSTCDAAFPNSGPFDITALTFSVAWQDTGVVCSTFDLPCQTGRIADAIFKPLIFFVNLGFFLLVSIIAILTYIGSVLFNLFIGLGGTFGFFFAIPGLPSVLQSIISAVFIAFLAWVSYLSFKTVRGSSTI